MIRHAPIMCMSQKFARFDRTVHEYFLFNLFTRIFWLYTAFYEISKSISFASRLSMKFLDGSIHLLSTTYTTHTSCNPYDQVSKFKVCVCLKAIDVWTIIVYARISWDWILEWSSWFVWRRTYIFIQIKHAKTERT